MKKAKNLAIALLLVTPVVACGEQPSSMSEAICTDFENGLTLNNISPRDSNGRPDINAMPRFARQVETALENCPEFKNAPGMERFLDHWLG